MSCLVTVLTDLATRKIIMIRMLSYAVLMLLLASCALNTSRQNDYVISKNTVAEITLRDIEQIKQTNGGHTVLPDEDVQRVFSWLASGDYERASKWLNQALSYQIDDSSLQFLNGLTYHLMSTQDVSKRPLAREGYMLAIRFGKNNWIAHRFLGILEMENKNYNQALNHLAEAALFSTEHDLLKEMGSAAYLAHQPSIAAGVFNQLIHIDPSNQQYQANYAITLAALGLNEQALASARNISTARRQYTLKRIDDWDAYHQRNPAPRDGEPSTGNLLTDDGFLLAQSAASPESWSEPDPDEYAPNERRHNTEYSGNDDTDDDKRPNQMVVLDVIPSPESWSEYDTDNGESNERRNDTENSGNNATDNDDKISNPMIVLDVVMIRSEEETRSSRGVNLLDGLHILFDYGQREVGGSLGTQSPVTFTNRDVVNGIDSPGLKYSLNIVNATSNRNEILARPSLIATNGKTSSFFSGLNLIAAAVGGRDGGAAIEVEKDIGVSVQVKPIFLKDGRIELDIQATRTFLTKPNPNTGFDLRVDTSKTEVNANVVMDIGDTLILSGLSEKETQVDRDGVPFLQDIPLVQYFFSSSTSLDFQRSVLILVTPRSPAYTAYTNREHASSNGLDRISGLESHYTDWFVPYPNWASVFNHLESSRLYREFRTGDVTLESWQSKTTLKARLLDAIKFLYY